MVLLDMMGRRGALRIIWELRDEPLTFRSLQAASATNPSLLNTRLKDLRSLGIVEHRDGGYRLTAGGRELFDSLRELQSWADTWLTGETDPS